MNKPTRQDVIHVLIVFVAAAASAAAILPGSLDAKALVAAIPALLVAGYRAIKADPAALQTLDAELPTVTARIHPEDIQHLTDLAATYENAAKRLELATVAARGVVVNAPPLPAVTVAPVAPVVEPAPVAPVAEVPTPAAPSPTGVGAAWIPASAVAPEPVVTPEPQPVDAQGNPIPAPSATPTPANAPETPVTTEAPPAA